MRRHGLRATALCPLCGDCGLQLRPPGRFAEAWSAKSDAEEGAEVDCFIGSFSVHAVASVAQRHVAAERRRREQRLERRRVGMHVVISPTLPAHVVSQRQVLVGYGMFRARGECVCSSFGEGLAVWACCRVRTAAAVLTGSVGLTELVQV